MPITDKIHENVQKLPEPLQSEVLDFVEFLLLKMERESTSPAEDDWTNLSLTLAMGGMEEEGGPIYTHDDLRDVFSCVIRRLSQAGAELRSVGGLPRSMRRI